MQKYLLYRKGLRTADIDQEDVKSDAQRALADWIFRERLLLDEAEERAALTFRFVEMRGYQEGYEGSCYWISFCAHRPYAKKEGHYPNRTSFDLWVYWDHDRWNVLPFKKATLDDDLHILMQSWKRVERAQLIPLLKEKEENGGSTTDDMYVDVLHRLQTAQVRLGASITYEEAEHIEKDEEGNEIYIPAGEVQVWFMVEDEIKLYEGDKIVLPHSAFGIVDLAEVVLWKNITPHPSIGLSPYEERMAQTTNLETLCSLINELADMGCEVSMKKEEQDGPPRVQVLDVEYINDKDGFDGLTSLLSRGKYRIHYLLFAEGAEKGSLNPDEIQTTELPTYMSFWVWYNQEAVRYRVDHGDEDALTYYHSGFLPKVRAARANGEIPSLLF
jgi:hypothetical protein